jgi:hypothetical protein
VALGVINIVLGSLALLGGICGGIVLIAAEGLMQADPNAAAQQKFLRDNLPGHDLMQWGGMLIMLLQGVALLVTGIGLLNVHNWARVTAIWCAALSLAWIAVQAVYYFAFTAPVMERFFGANQFPGGGDARLVMTFSTIIQVGMWLLFVAYALILIVMLSRPHVRELYTKQEHYEEIERFQDDELERDREENDDWYERRRRRDDESDYR